MIAVLTYEIKANASNWALPWSRKFRTSVDVANMEYAEFSTKCGHAHRHANIWTKQWVRDALLRVGLIEERSPEVPP